MIIAEKFYTQEELKAWNETRKLQLCQFIDGRTGGGTQAARREAARVTVAARVTAIGGGGGAAAAARVTGCRGWGSGACVGETSSSARTELKSAKFLATASGHLKA